MTWQELGGGGPSWAFLEAEGIEWLSAYFNCEVFRNDDEHAILDCILVNSPRYCTLEEEDPTPWAYGEVKGRLFPKGQFDTALLDRYKLNFARAVPIPSYLVVVWIDAYGLLELTKITDDQFTDETRTVKDPLKGKVEKEVVLLPVRLFIIEPRIRVTTTDYRIHFDGYPRGAYQP